MTLSPMKYIQSDQHSLTVLWPVIFESSLDAWLGVGHGLTAFHHRADLSDLDPVIHAVDGGPLGLPIEVGAAQAGLEWDVGGDLASLHAHAARVVGRHGQLHAEGVGDGLHHRGASVERERLLAAQLYPACADEGDLGGEGPRDAQHGGAADVPRVLLFRGLLHGHRLGDLPALVVGDAGEVHCLGRVLEELHLIDVVLHV